MKKFFAVTKFLWIGGFMGVIQQLFGQLDSILYQEHSVVFSFSDIMGYLPLYAAIILLVIRRDVPPKHQFRDLILFFIGLDFFYYLYIFIIDLIAIILDKMNPLDPTLDIETPFSQIINEIGDFIYWTTLGLAAAVWAFVATKLRNLGKKKLYIIMLLPLFAVIAFHLISSVVVTILFFITGGKPIPHSYDYGYSEFNCQISLVLTSLTALILCLYKFLKKPTVNKDYTQEA